MDPSSLQQPNWLKGGGFSLYSFAHWPNRKSINTFIQTHQNTGQNGEPGMPDILCGEALLNETTVIFLSIQCTEVNVLSVYEKCSFC